MAAGAAASAPMACGGTIEVDLADKHQVIEGFGTCLISWGKFPEEVYTPSFAKTYGQEMGLNFLRCELAGGTLPEPVDDPKKIDRKKFKLGGYSGSAEVFLDFAKRLRDARPDARIIGTVWTPPGWMKEHGQGAGDPALAAGRKSGSIAPDSYKGSKNYVKKEFYPHFVKWLVEMALLFKDQGTPLYAVSPGNEVQFTQWFQSCAWTAEDYAEIIGLLGEALEKERLDIKIFGPETMTGHNFAHGNPPYIKALMRDAKAKKHFGVFATHGYTDGATLDVSQNSSAQFWELIEGYGLPYWVTEGGTGGHAWPEPLKGVASAIHNSFVHGNASAFVPWQIAEEKPSTHALMTADGLTKKSHAVRHFSKFIPPGSVRVGADPSEGDAQAGAYWHEATRRLTVVLINQADEERALKLRIKGNIGARALDVFRTSAEEDLARVGSVALGMGGEGEVTVPAKSMVTLTSGTGALPGGPVR